MILIHIKELFMIKYLNFIKLPNNRKNIKILLNSFPEISSTEDDIQYIIEPKISGIDVSIYINNDTWKTSNINQEINEILKEKYETTILFIQDMTKNSEYIDNITLYCIYNQSNEEIIIRDMFINKEPIPYITTTQLFYHWKSCWRSNVEMKPFTILPVYPITTNIETFLIDILENKKDNKEYLETTDYIERLPSFNKLPKGIFDNGFVIKSFNKVIKNK